MYDWEEIRKAHGEMVWSIVARILRNREDAAECYQEVFFEAFRSASKKPVDNPAGLLRWLAVRRALDTVRQLSRRKSVSLHGDLSALVLAARADEERCSELLEEVRCELTRIPSKQAEAFWLFCIEEYSCDEVASSLGVQPEYVGTLVYRARQHLRKKLNPTPSPTSRSFSSLQ